MLRTTGHIRAFLAAQVKGIPGAILAFLVSGRLGQPAPDEQPGEDGFGDGQLVRGRCGFHLAFLKYEDIVPLGFVSCFSHRSLDCSSLGRQRVLVPCRGKLCRWSRP